MTLKDLLTMLQTLCAYLFRCEDKKSSQSDTIPGCCYFEEDFNMLLHFSSAFLLVYICHPILVGDEIAILLYIL